MAESAEIGQPVTTDVPMRVVSEQEIWLEETEAGGVAGSLGLAADKAESLSEAPSLGSGGFGRVDEHSGAYSYSVDVFAPPSRIGGPVPSLSAVYNCNQTDAPNFLAAGWRFAVGFVERKGLLDELPDFGIGPDSEDTFTLQFNGASFTLVRLSEEAESDTQRIRFRAKIEGAFLNAEAVLSQTAKDPDSSGEAEIDHWVVHDADGNTYQFGRAGSAGETNPTSATVVRNKVWHLVETLNPYGVRARYEYAHSKDPRFPDHVHPIRLERVIYDVSEDNPDGNFEIRLAYTRLGADPQSGFHRLGEGFSGRSGARSVIWDRLEHIETRYRAFDRSMRPVRRIVFSAGAPEPDDETRRVEATASARIELKSVIERSFDPEGRIDRDAQLPAHFFFYSTFGGHRSLLTRAVEPMGLTYRIDYDLVRNLSDGTNIGLDGAIAVGALQTVGDGETNRTSYRYRQGVFFAHLNEHRGFEQVLVKDHTAGQIVETTYTQTGIHNGFVRDRTEFLEVKTKNGTEKRILERMQNAWLALDFGGGRYHPFPTKTTTTSFNEDGDRVLTTTVTEVAPSDVPWEFAIDPLGNVLDQVTSIYEGSDTRAAPLRRTRQRTEFENIIRPGFRIVARPKYEESVVEEAGKDDIVTDWRSTEFDELGREKEAVLGLHRSDKSLFHRKKNARADNSVARLSESRLKGEEAQELLRRRYYEKGPYSGLLETETNAIGQSIHYLDYDLRFGKPTRVRRPNGIILNCTFDGLGRPLLQTFEPATDVSSDTAGFRDDLTNVRHAYFVEGDRRTITITNADTGATSTDFYDARLRKIREIESGFDQKDTETFITYDQRTGNVETVSEPVFVGEEPRHFHKTTYDERGRVLVESPATGGTLHHRYGDFSDEISERVFAVEEDGSIGALIDERVTGRVEKDIFGRVVSRSQGEPGSDEFYELRYEHDHLDRIVSIRDSMNRLLHKIDYGARLDDKPVSIFDEAGGRRHLDYDAFGNLSHLTANGAGDQSVEARFHHDALDRVIHEDVADAASGYRKTVDRVFDSATHGEGLLASASIREEHANGDVTIKDQSFEYDAYAQPSLTKHRWRIDWASAGTSKDVALHLRTEHDGKRGSRLDKVTYPTVSGTSGGSAEFRYDEATGAVTEILFDGASIWRLGIEGLDARLKPFSCQWGNDLAQSFTYDRGAGRLQRSTLNRGSRTLLDLKLTYDTAGNVLGLDTIQADAERGAADFSSHASFGYDSQDQLTSIVEGSDRVDYHYRADGARRAVVTNGQTATHSYDPSRTQQLKTVLGAGLDRTLEYDPAGRVSLDRNKEADVTLALEWTTDSTLATARTLAKSGVSHRSMLYAYGPQGALSATLAMPKQKLTLHLDVWFEVVYEPQQKAPLLRSHIVSGGQRVATVERRKDQPQRILYYHRDHVGSVRLITDQDGRIVSSSRYRPFGELEEQSGERPDLAFGGYRADTEDDPAFAYLDTPARPYDPSLGRFMAPDIVADPGNGAFGHNRYSFCGNNPLSRVDPTGFSSEKLEPYFVMPEITAEERALGEKEIKTKSGRIETMDRGYQQAAKKRIWAAKNGLDVTYVEGGGRDISKQMVTAGRRKLNIDATRMHVDQHGANLTKKRAQTLAGVAAELRTEEAISYSCEKDTWRRRWIRKRRQKAFTDTVAKLNGKKNAQLTLGNSAIHSVIEKDSGNFSMWKEVADTGDKIVATEIDPRSETPLKNTDPDVRIAKIAKDDSSKVTRAIGKLNNVMGKIGKVTDKLGAVGDVIDKVMLPLSVGAAVAAGNYMGAALQVGEAALMLIPAVAVTVAVVGTAVAIADYFTGGAVSETISKTASKAWNKTKEWFSSWW